MCSLCSAHTADNKATHPQLCQFEFNELTVETVVRLVKVVCGDKQPGMDGIDGKLIGMSVDYVVQPICHILNTSLKLSIFPQAWKDAKITPDKPVTSTE